MGVRRAQLQVARSYQILNQCAALEGQPLRPRVAFWGLFWEKDLEIFPFESRNIKISGKQQNVLKQQNLNSNETRTENSQSLKRYQERLP